MSDVTVFGVDLAKRFFQVHGVEVGGKIVSRRLRRDQVIDFFAGRARCVIAMEACASAHHWGRSLAALGHEVRLLPTREVKPFVRPPKTDASDAAAIWEAAHRPMGRVVPVKSEEAQSVCTAHVARSGLIGQRTALVNMIRGHLAEYGIVARVGQVGAKELQALARGTQNGEEAAAYGALPRVLRHTVLALVEALDATEAAIGAIEMELAEAAKGDEATTRLREVDGIGLLTASALRSFVGDFRRFADGRAFVAWLGLAPRVEASGGKTWIGGIGKAGNGYLRCLLIHGARSLLQWSQRGKAGGRRPWLDALLTRRPRPVAITALAAKLARIVWAMMARGERYRRPAVAA